MQTVAEVMTRDARVVSPQESVQRAAQLMDELNVGALPVCDGHRLVGMVTDRDITIRATAAGRAPADAHVDEVMSTDVRWCFEDEDIDEVVKKMSDTQIRRVPVISHDDQKRLVGIVALGDLLTRSGQSQAAEAAGKISSPSAPERSGAGGAATGAQGGYAAGSEAGESMSGEAPTGQAAPSSGSGQPTRH